MIKLSEIARVVIKEGGKLFGTRASRVTTDEMNKVYSELKDKLGDSFVRFELSKALPSKADHGDVDIVVLTKPTNAGFKSIVTQGLKNDVIDYSTNGNIHSVLYHSKEINKDVHVDFLTVDNAEDFDPQYEYLWYNDFSGILEVMARQLHFNYGTQGFFKIYEDKQIQNHYILITKNLREGLRILGYGTILDKFDDIQTPDDVIDFISSSPFFDSKMYVGQDMNHSDRKRVRSGRPTADYIRKKLIESNKHRSLDDEDYFLKKIYPKYYEKVLASIHEIENKVVFKPKYNGEWILKNFDIKPGPIINKIKNFWVEVYGDQTKVEAVPENELLTATRDYLNDLTSQR